MAQIEEIADGTQDVLKSALHTDEGLVGVGEVSSQSYVCKAIFKAPRSAERRHELAYLLRGQDPRKVEGLWQYLSHPVTQLRILRAYADKTSRSGALAASARALRHAPQPIPGAAFALYRQGACSRK